YCWLKNEGSTCYLNAVLHMLFMTKEFRERVKEKSASSGDKFIKELNDLFEEMRTQSKEVSAAKVRMSLDIKDDNKQRDAAEYLQKILKKTPGPSE
ncbi:hypothetical protein ABG768_017695, partial [Culter alburnus]